MKYFTRIQKLGKDSLTFLGDPDSNFIILFNDNAPPAFEDLCVLHTIEELRANIEPGDMMQTTMYGIFVLADIYFTISFKVPEPAAIKTSVSGSRFKNIVPTACSSGIKMSSPESRTTLFT